MAIRAGVVRTIVAAAVAVLALGPAVAAELRIGLKAPPTTLDPHHENFAPNLTLAAHVFDRLMIVGPRQRQEPGLATDWRPIAPTVWELTLRRGVTFHDGSAFDAADVVASWRRAKAIPGHSMAVYLRAVKDVRAVDPHTVHVETNRPYPLLPADLAQFPIVAAEQEQAPQAAFDDGGAVIGTGPFTLEHYEPGQRVTLAANPSWWGGAPVWDRVEIHYVPDDVARVTALTEGRLDLVDSLSPYELERLAHRPQVTLPTTSTSRVIYLAFDRRPGVPAGTTAIDGSPLAANPFDDLRVRRAVSLSIDRATLVAESLSGLGQPAAQIVPAYLEGASATLEPDAFDPQRARALLREAGYPDGFATRLACTEGRYLNDVAVCRAVALALAGIGIRTEVTTHTGGEFFARAEKGEFPIRMAGWATGTGEASYGLRGLVMTHDPASGSGMANASRYTNPAVDALVREASTSFDAAERGRLLARAMELAMEDLALVPMYFQGAVWGARKGIAYEPPIEEFTRAIDVRPADAPH